MENQTKLAVYRLCRLVLGLLFVFSGFVKCIDPIGGAIKIEDYFVAWGWVNSPWWFALTLSLIQNTLEFIVGVMLLNGSYLRASSLVALAFMAFYTPLTLYIALEDPVSDCGCFGDAVKLTNWQTFWKNLVFLPIAFIVYYWRGVEVSHKKRWKNQAFVFFCFAVAALVMFKGVNDEPLVDFRPYSVGTDINAAMSIPKDAPMPEYKTVFLLEKDGVVQEFDEHNYPYDDSTWVYRDTHTETISEGYMPSITDFSFIDTQDNDFSQHLLTSQQPVFLAISPKIEKVGDRDLKKLGTICDEARKQGFEFFVATSSNVSFFADACQKAESDLEFLLADETMLKTITRSNLGLIIIQNGVISAKYSIAHMQRGSVVKMPVASYLADIERSYDWMQIICLTLMIAVFRLVLKDNQSFKRNRHYNDKQIN